MEILHPRVRPKRRPSTRRWKLPALLDAVRAKVLESEYGWVKAEDIASELRAKVPMVRQCFHKLNLEGILSQASNDGPHDSHRNRGMFGSDAFVSAWVASLYYVRKPKDPV